MDSKLIKTMYLFVVIATANLPVALFAQHMHMAHHSTETRHIITDAECISLRQILFDMGHHIKYFHFN